MGGSYGCIYIIYNTYGNFILYRSEAVYKRNCNDRIQIRKGLMENRRVHLNLIPIPLPEILLAVYNIAMESGDLSFLDKKISYKLL